MSNKAYGSITVTDLLDTATYIYYSATGSNTAADWHITPTANDKYIGIYGGPPVDGGQPATPANFMSSLVISKYVGENGERGGLILNITTAPTAYTTKVGNFTPAYRIAKSTVLTQSGSSDVKVGDTLAYSYYHYQVGYVDSSYVYLGAAKNIRGEAGAAATRYSLIVSPSVIVKNQEGVYSSSTVVLKANFKFGTNAEAVYNGRFAIEQSADNGSNWATVYISESDENTYTLSAIPTGIKVLRCSLYLAGGTTTLLDQQTIPIVSDGTNAIQYYTYVRYSANSNGSSYTDTPSSSTKYIGVCVSTSSTAPVYNDSAWKWSKYIGENGTSATQYYTYVRYSANSNGSSYVETPTTSTKYIGVCVTTATSAPAYNNSAWKWSKYIGENGDDAYTVLLTNESHSFIEGETESTLCGVITYKGATQVSCYVGSSTSATSINTGITGLTCTISNNNSTNVQLTFRATASLTTNYGVVSIPIYVDGKNFTKTFSFSLSLKGDTGVSIVKVTPLYYAKSNSTAPDAPTTAITITTTTGGQWTQGIPELTSTYPFMFTCEQIQYDSTSVGTNGYKWTDPVLNNMITKFVENYNSFVEGDTEWKNTYGQKITTIGDTVDNLQIGGRNLFINSAKYHNEENAFETSSNKKDNYTSSFDGKTIYTNSTFSTGDTVCIQAKSNRIWSNVHATSGQNNGTVGFWLQVFPTVEDAKNGTNIVTSTFLPGDNISTEFKKTWIIPSNHDGKAYNFRFNSYSDGSTIINAKFWDVKLERGNKVTDWTPAPEDIEVRVTAAETSITQNADAIALRATKTEVTEAINDIEIGSRNLILDSEPVRSNGNYILCQYRVANASDFVTGETYTVSLEGEFDSSKTTWYTNIYSQQHTGDYYPNFATAFTKKNGRWQATATMPDLRDEDAYGIGVYAAPFGAITTGTNTVAKVKVEKGNKATDWTPAPEDLEAYTDSAVSDAKAEIQITTDGISSEVSKISSAKYVTSATSSWSLTNIKTYAAEEHVENWNVTSTSGLRVGDTVYVTGTDSTRNCKIYIKTTVTAINSSTNFTGTSHGYEDVLPVETIKSTINQSADSVKITANHVDIEGATIFTSGRLSQASLNDAYDAKGAALDVVTAKDTRSTNESPQWYITNYPKRRVQEFKGSATIGITNVETYCWLQTDVPWGDSSGGWPKQMAEVNGRQYWRHGTSATAWSAWVDAYGTAVNAKDTADAAAPKSSAIAEEQRIYYRSKVNTKPSGNALPTTWITNTGNVWNDTATVAAATGWTRKVTPIANGTGSSVTKYLYLWTCIQKKTVSGTVTYGDILLDDSTTVIDGGNIVTGTIDANRLNATSVNTSGILTVGALSNDAQSKVLNSNVSIGGRNLWKNTSTPVTLSPQTAGTAGDNYNFATIYFANSLNIKQNEAYTISGHVTFTSADTSSYPLPSSFSAYLSYQPTISFTNISVDANGNFAHVVYAEADGNNATKSLLYAGLAGSTRGLGATFSNLKIEKGNKATDWSPAPEDVYAREQIIYYRTNSTSLPQAPSTWVANSDTRNSDWTTKKMPYDSTYKYLYTCLQSQKSTGEIVNSTVTRDETITIIDGGNIITGTLDASKITTGILTDSTNKNSWNLDTGALTITNGSINISTSNESNDYIKLTSTGGINTGMTSRDFYIHSTQNKNVSNYGTSQVDAHLGGGTLLDGTGFGLRISAGPYDSNKTFGYRYSSYIDPGTIQLGYSGASEGGNDNYVHAGYQGITSTRKIVSSEYLQAPYFQDSNNNVMSDFVIDEGTSSVTGGNWFYRKWVNGCYECWFRSSSNVSVACTTAWGSLYYGTIATINFPITFIDYPVLQVTVQAAVGGAWAAPDYPSKSASGPIYMYRPTSLTLNCRVNLYAQGQWK